MEGYVGTKIDVKVTSNIVIGEVFPLSPYMETFYSVFFGDTIVNVDIFG